MINKSTIKRLAGSLAIAAAFVLVSGSFSEAHAQRDPFKKAGWAVPKKPISPSTAKVKSSAPPVIVNYGPPAVEARLEYFKRLRDAAANSGQPLPKVTSVMTLNELAITGIFKTPRGWAAMVEVTPVKLSYPIYPGEKFFDGQLVAIEENRLVFRKVTKVADGKFVASVENKALRQFSMKSQVEGTAPTQPGDKPVETASNLPPADAKTPGKDARLDSLTKITNTNQFLSPLDEMNNQTGKPDSGKDKAKKPVKTPVKVAKNGGKQ